MLTGAAAAIKAGGDVVITEAVTRLSIDTPGRATVTDTSTNTTFFVLSDVEQAAAATSNDTSTQSLIAATGNVVALVGDGTLGISGQSAAASATNLATAGGTTGTFGDEEKKKDDKASDGKDSGSKDGTGKNAELKSVKTCT